MDHGQLKRRVIINKFGMGSIGTSVWRGTIEGWSRFKENEDVDLGNGNQISIGHHSWCKGETLCLTFSQIYNTA